MGELLMVNKLTVELPTAAGWVTYLFIPHSLPVVARLANHIA